MSSVHVSRRVIGLHRVGENGLAEVTTGPMGLTVNSSERMVYVFHLLHRPDLAEQSTHRCRGGAPVPEKKFMADLEKARTKLTVVVAISTLSGAFMTWLAMEGVVSLALLRVSMSFAEVSWFALIAAVCTHLCLAQINRCKKLQKDGLADLEGNLGKRLAEFERRRDNSMQVFIEETAEQVAERLAEELKLEQLNSEYRKLN